MPSRALGRALSQSQTGHCPRRRVRERVRQRRAGRRGVGTVGPTGVQPVIRRRQSVGRLHTQRIDHRVRWAPSSSPSGQRRVSVLHHHIRPSRAMRWPAQQLARRRGDSHGRAERRLTGQRERSRQRRNGIVGIDHTAAATGRVDDSAGEVAADRRTRSSSDSEAGLQSMRVLWCMRVRQCPWIVWRLLTRQRSVRLLQRLWLRLLLQDCHRRKCCVRRVLLQQLWQRL
jgi:hypothetical protein